MGKAKRATKEKNTVDISQHNWARVCHNYLMEEKNGSYSLEELNRTLGFLNYLFTQKPLPKYKVGVLLVCINQHYWPYALPVIDGIKKLFLHGHDTEIMMWADFAEWPEAKDVNYGTTVFHTPSIEWPYPTLMRYHMFLKQEEYLKKFDYLFYVDLDMRIVNVVGDELFGDGLTAAQHPMYALRRNLIPPYEPNENSTAFIKRPGRIMEDNGKLRFEPLYYAGGLQGGRTADFIEAMKCMQEAINKDMDNGYIAIWNDESHWNKYLSEHQPAVVLNPSYVYPDSLIDDYYVPLWGRNYEPRIITITKPFSLSKQGGAAIQETIGQMKKL